MKLSFKDTQFVLEAIDSLVSKYQEILEQPSTTEDEASDLGNDLMFIQSLHQSLTTSLENTSAENSPNLSIAPLTYEIVSPNLSGQELTETVLRISIEKRLALIDAITQSIRQEMPSAS